MTASGRATSGPLTRAVVVADDHPFFRDGVIRGLTRQSGRVEAVAEAGTGRETVEADPAGQPDGRWSTTRCRTWTAWPSCTRSSATGWPPRCCCCRPTTDGGIVFQALQEGAAGYRSKDAGRAGDRRGGASGQGRTVVPGELAAALAGEIRLRARSQEPVLSDRERQVLPAFARGLSIPQVAGELYLGVSTVKTHTQRLYEKLGVADRAAAVAEGMRRGLLK